MLAPLVIANSTSRKTRPCNMDPSSAADFLKVAMRAALRGILAERLGEEWWWV